VEPGELEVARAFADREAWAYEAAYREHGRTLYAAALQVLRDSQESQDCVHDVLMRLWRRGAAYRPERGSLRAFLAVCVRNESLARLRNARNRERIVRSVETPGSTDDIAAAVADRETLRPALGALAEKQRQTIELAYYQRYTLEEIARRLGEPLGTIKSRLSAALRKLRDTLAMQEPPNAG